MPTNRWTVSIGTEGTVVTLWEYDLRARFWAAVDHAFDVVCEGTGGKICGACGPEWMWKIPAGKPRYYDDQPAMLSNSLPALLISIQNTAAIRVIRSARRIERIPVDRETAMRLWPQFDFEDWDRMGVEIDAEDGA